MLIMQCKHFVRILVWFVGNKIVKSYDKFDMCTRNDRNVNCDGEIGILHWGKCQNHKVLRRLQNRSFLDCVKECISTSHCTGISYRNTWRTCDIVENGDPFDTSHIEENGCVSTEIASWDKTIAGKCTDHPCARGESCFYNTTQGITCRKTYCATFPTIDNATVSEQFGPHRNVNQGVKYSCNGRKFGMIGNPIAVCRPSGEWDVMFKCQKLQPTCPDGWILTQGIERCYKIHAVKKTWQNANEFCKTERSLLVELEDVEEWEIVSKLLFEMTDATHDYYVGSIKDGKTTTTDQAFKWTSSLKEVDSNLYGPNEPNGRPTENLCLEMAQFTKYKLDDDFCNRKMGFLCEMEPQYEWP